MIRISALSLWLVFLAALSAFCLAQSAPQVQDTAWDVLLRDAPDLARSATPEERRILETITPALAQAFAEGADPETLRLPDGRTLASLFAAMDAFSIPWWTVDAGGGKSVGGTFELNGTIGQTDGATLTGGAFTLNGGFWSESTMIFTDGFETGGTSHWSSTVGEP